MNEVFLMGSILSIEYNLIDRGKIYAIAFVNLKVNKNVIKLISKNSMADYIYSHIQEKDKVIIRGCLMDTKKGLYVNIETIEFIKGKNL